MRGARLGGPVAHVQKSQKSLGLRPRSVSHEPHTTDLTRTEYVVRHGFQERHELVAGLAGRRDGLAGRRGDLTGPRGRASPPWESSTTGDDNGVDRSEVIRRHLSAGAGTPLYT